MTLTLCAEIVGLVVGIALLGRAIRCLSLSDASLSSVQHLRDPFRGRSACEELHLTNAEKDAESYGRSFISCIVFGMVIAAASFACLLGELWFFPELFRYWNS